MQSERVSTPSPVLCQATRGVCAVSTLLVPQRARPCSIELRVMSKPVLPPAAGSRDRLAGVVSLTAVFLLACAYSLFFGWLSLERYWGYQMHALDMGNMGQAAWNTIHGHPFYFTNMRLPYNIEAWNTTTRLSFHVEAAFPVIAAVYLIYPHPESLLVLQSVGIALGAFAVYLLARDVLANRLLGVAFAAVYCLFPSLEGMNLYEFHPVSLATPLLLFAFLFAWRRQYLPFVLFCLAAMGTKEQIGLTVAMFGLYVALVNRDWAVGLGMAAAGICWSLFAALIVEKHFRAPGTRTYLRERYGYLGHGVGGALNVVLHHPGVVLNVVLTDAKAEYVRELLQPAGFLAFFAAPLLLLALPSFVLNLFSTTAAMYSALGDNSAEIISVVMIASILGCRVLLGLLGGWVPRGTAAWALATFLVVMALWDQHLAGFTPIGARYQSPVIGPHERIEQMAVARIPSEVPVSTQDVLDPHLSSRHYLYLFPDTGRRPNPPLPAANSILLDAPGTTYPLTSTEMQQYAQAYIHRRGWGVALADNGVILIQKGAPSRRIPPAFYSYMLPTKRPDHGVRLESGGLRIVGYDVREVDLANFRIPRLAFTFYVQAKTRPAHDLQPVLFEQIGASVTCSTDPLGLAWMPTTRWVPGRTYVVRMAPQETDWSSRATARFFVAIERMERPHFNGCPALPSASRRTAVGALTIAF